MRKQLIKCFKDACNTLTDARLEALEKEKELSLDECEEIMADHLIVNGVTIQKWIPVTERLPEDDLVKDSKVKLIKVLVFYKNSMGVPVVRTQIRQKGCRYHRDEWNWVKFEPITHWMPLPEPPHSDCLEK